MNDRQDEVRIALVIPLQGPAGIFGPSCEAVATTAVRLINEQPLLGRRMMVEGSMAVRRRRRWPATSSSSSTPAW